MNGRFHDKSKSAAARIGAVAGHFTRERYNQFRRIPDDADYRDELEPYVQLEILIEVLKTLEKYGHSYKEALEVVSQIEKLKTQIAAKKPVTGEL